ncbi:APC family permease [soil metagenome]
MEGEKADSSPERKSGSASSGDKGLRGGAIGFVSSVVIGVASTAPGYSLAATLGFIVAAGVGLASPAILIVSFIPMLCIAFAYYYMNRDDPDCGTSFTWVTSAMGPYMGWITGWAIIVADVIVMANLAQIAGLYSFLLFGINDPSVAVVTLIGIVWIIIMTAIVTIGIELSARTQVGLLGAEILTLGAFAVVALIKVYTTDVPHSIDPALSWFSPFSIDSTSALISGVLLGVFIYWGWDSAVTVNEETDDPTESPGRSAVASTIILVLIYVIVAVAAQAYAGTDFLKANKDDVLSSLGTAVFGSPLDKLLIIAVLTSAAASTQTTILPTARTSLSMAAARAIPKTFARVHEKFQTPHISTVVFGVVSILWYVGLTILSEKILADSLEALGLMIAFYYGLTGFAAAIYYRHELTSSVKAFIAAGVLPVLGGLMLGYVFVKSTIDLAQPGNRDVFGVGVPLAIAIFFGVLGLILMLLQRRNSPEFFKRKRQVAPHGALIGKATPGEASFAAEP